MRRNATFIRDEILTDAGDVEELIVEAFTGHPHSEGREAEIVRRLRDADALTLSLVAVVGNAVVGHVAFSPITIDHQNLGWYGLGPISVAPDHQNQGVGSALVRDGLKRLQDLGASGCVVLGDPSYYERFGFTAHSQLKYPGPPPEYFQVLNLNDDQIPGGVVRYHAAFG